MRIRLAIPDRFVTPGILDAVLEAQTRAAAAQIRAGEAPDARAMIANGVRWRPEPWAEEHFDLPAVVAARGWGDCDDLAPALAGSLRASGEDDGARAVVYQSGPHRYHVVVRTSLGEILDPSLDAGMKRHAGIRGATVRSMANVGGGGLAVARDGALWAARCDVPWPNGPAHVASVARARSRAAAIGQAVVGARYVGEAIESPLAARAEELGDELLSVAGDWADDAQRGADLGTAAAPALALIPGAGAILAAAAPAIGAVIASIASLASSKAGLPVGAFDPIESTVQGCAQSVDKLENREQARALRALCVRTNEALANLQSQPNLSGWDRQHCADLGAIVLDAAARIDARMASLPDAPHPSSRATASAAGKNARVYTLPSGASLAFGSDGRTMVVRF